MSSDTPHEPGAEEKPEAAPNEPGTEPAGAVTEEHQAAEARADAGGATSAEQPASAGEPAPEAERTPADESTDVEPTDEASEFAAEPRPAGEHVSASGRPMPQATAQPDTAQAEAARADAVRAEPHSVQNEPAGADVGDDTAAYDVIAVEYDEVDGRDTGVTEILPPEPSRPPEPGAWEPPLVAAAEAGAAGAAVGAAGAGAAGGAAGEGPGWGAPAAVAPATPMYVTAPTAPTMRGNRGIGILIDVVATVAYVIVFAAVALGLFALRDPHTAVNVWERYLQTAGFWTPVVAFFIAELLLILIVNRAGWWSHLLGSFFVGVAVYFAYLGGALLTVQSWTLSQNEVGQFVGTLWTSALTIASAIVAREVSAWFGAWLAARGRRMRERNLQAKQEYERRLAEGPTGYAAPGGNGRAA